MRAVAPPLAAHGCAVTTRLTAHPLTKMRRVVIPLCASPWRVNVQAYDAKTHPLLWQHPTKKQTLLELAARSNCAALLKSLLPALNLTRLAGSGARSAGGQLQSPVPRAAPPWPARHAL